MKNEISETDLYLPFHLNSYWEEFYRNTDLNNFFEWYFELADYSSKSFDILNWDKQIEIIIIGVGNSNFINFLVENKFEHVTLVDYSSTLINFLKNKYENLEQCKEWDFICEDITKLTKSELVPQNVYEIVIDKGCIDCIFSDPTKDINEIFSKTLTEIKNILTDNGILYFFSTLKPDKIIQNVSTVFNSNIDVEHINLNTKSEIYTEFNEEDNMYYLYKIKKI